MSAEDANARNASTPAAFDGMPRFFFHLYENGREIIDDLEVDVETIEQVRIEAMRVLPAVATDEVPRDGDQQAYTVVVTNQQRRPVYTATLSFAGVWLNQSGDEPPLAPAT